MATEKDLLIKINADVSDLRKKFGDATAEVDRLDKSIASLTKKSAATFVAATASASGLVKVFADYEQALVGVAKTTDLSNKELEDFSKGIDKLSQQIPNLSAKELLNLSQTAGQLGVKGTENLLAFTETYAKLGTATDIAGEEGAASIARLLTVTGEGIEAIKTFGDVIVDLGNSSAATEGEILTVATRLSSIASFGVRSTDILAISAALKSVGLEAESAGTSTALAFDAFASAISEGGEKIETLQRVTGLTNEELRKTFAEDSVEVFRLFSEGLKQVPAEELKNNLDTLGLSGVRVRELFRKLSTSGDLLSNSLEKANEAAKDGEALNNEFNRANETLAANFGKLKNAASLFAKNIGKQLAPAFNDLILRATDFLKKLNALDKDTLKNIANFLKWTIAITGLTTAVGVLGGAFLKLRTILKGLGILSLVNPFSKLKLAIAGVTGAFFAFKKVFAKEPDVKLDKITDELGKIADQEKKLQKIVKNGSDEQKEIAINQLLLLSKKREKLNELAIEQDGLNKIISSGNAEQEEQAKKRLEEINKEIEAVKDLQSLKSETQEQEKEDAPDNTLDAKKAFLEEERQLEKEKTNFKAQETQLRIEEAKREQQLLKDISKGLSDEQIQIEKDKNNVIADQQKILLDNKIINEKLSQETLSELKREELEKQLEFNNIELENLQIKQDQIREKEVEFEEERKERLAEEQELKAENDQFIRELELENQIEFNAQQRELLEEHLSGKKQITDQFLLEKLKAKQENDARLLSLEQKFGLAFAKTDRFFRDERVKGARDVSGQLVSLKESENSKLKSIGKAAAVANIAIDSAKGAVSAYASLAPIPFVGPVLGAAAAAALLAFGAEQTAKASGAVRGGFVDKGRAGVDDQPFMLSRGEAITPARITPELFRTFETLDSIKSSGGLTNFIMSDMEQAKALQQNINLSEQQRSKVSAQAGNTQNIVVDINLEDDIVDFITAKQRENDQLQTGVL